MRDLPPSAPRHARGITPDDGDGDEEHPHTRKRTKVQSIITAHIDSGVREGLLQMHEGEGCWAARTRLAELSDPNVDHTWLWRLNPRHGRLWTLTSMFTRSAFAWAALGLRRLSLAPPATLASWTRAQRTPPAAPWARPHVVTTLSPPSYTQLHYSVTTPLRWRYLGSSLARTCDPPMSSPQPWVMTTRRWTCPFALHTLWRLALTAHSPGWRPSWHTMAPTWLPSFVSVWSAYGRPHADTLTVLRSLSKSIARKRNIASAEVVFHRLHSSIGDMETQCTANTHMLARDGSPGLPGLGHLAPARGLLS